MKKKLIFIFFLCLTLVLSGCGNKDWLDTHKEFAKTEKVRFEKTPEVFTSVLSQVVLIFTETVEQSVNKNLNRKPVYTKTTTMNNGEVIEENVYSEVDAVLAYFIERDRIQAKKETIQYIIPFVERIMTQKQLELERPVTVADVLKELAGHTPLIATVLGFYGIVGEMADKVGNNITSNLSNGSSINIQSKGTRSTYNNTTNHEIVTPPE